MPSSEHRSCVRKLYKLIFRIHQALPPELRVMGNNYVRDEFKRHKNCNPEEARIFMREWTEYAINMAKQFKAVNQAHQRNIGMPLDPKLLDHMTDDQIVQLYELHKAATQPFEPPVEDATDVMESQSVNYKISEVAKTHFDKEMKDGPSTSKKIPFCTKIPKDNIKTINKDLEGLGTSSGDTMETEFNGNENGAQKKK